MRWKSRDLGYSDVCGWIEEFVSSSDHQYSDSSVHVLRLHCRMSEVP